MSHVEIKYGSGGMPVLAHAKSGGSVLLTFNDKAPHKPAKPSEEEAQPGVQWVPWGQSDDFPREIAKLMRKSTVGRAGLQRLTKYLYGQRIITYKITDIAENGREVIQFVKDPVWEEIKRRSNFNLVRLGTFQEYCYGAITFMELIFSADKSQVTSLFYHKNCHCRFAPRNEKTGKLTYVYVGDFPNTTVEKCQKVPVIDMLDWPSELEDIRADKKQMKYIMPLYWPDAINDYYPVPFWDSARESGWLDIAISIPAYKKALFKNQISIKYQVDIPLSYFRAKYVNWDNMKQKERDDAITKVHDEINDMLVGAENAKKSVLTFFEDNQRTGKISGQWEFKAIDDKMKHGEYLPDSSAANSEILFAMGINPAVSGQGNTGGSYTGGANNGGSNIRESGLDQRSQLRADRDLLLSWFDFIKAYNGMDPELELGVQDQVLTTLDEGRGTEKVVS